MCYSLPSLPNNHFFPFFFTILQIRSQPQIFILMIYIIKLKLRDGTLERND